MLDHPVPGTLARTARTPRAACGQADCSQVFSKMEPTVANLWEATTWKRGNISNQTSIWFEFDCIGLFFWYDLSEHHLWSWNLHTVNNNYIKPPHGNMFWLFWQQHHFQIVFLHSFSQHGDCTLGRVSRVGRIRNGQNLGLRSSWQVPFELKEELRASTVSITIQSPISNK